MRSDTKRFLVVVVILLVVAIVGSVVMFITKPKALTTLSQLVTLHSVATTEDEGKTEDKDKTDAKDTSKDKEADKADAAADSKDKDKNEGEDKSEETTETANPVDVSNVDIDVAAMSDEEAFTFMHDFLNRTPDALEADYGKVMHIKGQVGRYTKVEDDGDHVSYSVGIKGEGGTIWAICFYVEGWSPEDYPEHKSIAEVTGVYGEVEGYGNAAGKTLICNAEDIKVVEE